MSVSERVKIDVGQLGPLQDRLERSIDQVLCFDGSTDLVWEDEVVFVPSLDGTLDVLMVAMCAQDVGQWGKQGQPQGQELAKRCDGVSGASSMRLNATVSVIGRIVGVVTLILYNSAGQRHRHQPGRGVARIGDCHDEPRHQHELTGGEENLDPWIVGRSSSSNVDANLMNWSSVSVTVSLKPGMPIGVVVGAAVTMRSFRLAGVTFCAHPKYSTLSDCCQQFHRNEV